MYLLRPLFACFRVWFVSRGVTNVISLTTPCELCKLDIIGPVYLKLFGIVYVGAFYVFLVIVIVETKKTVNSTFAGRIWTLLIRHQI